ncbi:acetyl/propionyl/methylcrotonyl-CoA carboxylase subunit alpha [Oceanicoccus sagamiensis]|uniref:Biotin carboxylase n=1 Tax=Oceanicoccus sagamiensis TaxID=716816 RepID=A0A1X9NI99_9GAMM|nr:acetyl-CoA carboxylase biotin carboxylase subunit [Oceanicoccus sagamiensis]ARN75565.1 3-methylcrotonyl-CoA carboxylase [Oceanicoccus sagamiensis]
MRRFNSILVANRGEIAVRVISTAKQLGYRTVAVYSEADADAIHVKMADDAIAIGPSPANESYLVIDNILAAAKAAGAEAIHPGYGFLSENAEFAKACEQADLVFIGPSAESIALMGNKAEAKRHMIKAQVPCVPGYEEKDQTDEVLMAAAENIGYPIMAKAAAGGGGRGMSLVHKAEDLVEALRSARSVALNSFGSDEMILEKAIINPRHVEIQIFADTQGNVIHLGERDCSVQRRHQKVVEEAPCPVMSDKLRESMGAAAVEAARAINYRGAGTVEFLLDDQGHFYFLEMNTRLQVEHPVTELITGQDLVAMQIQVAQGQALSLSQQDIQFNGHAMEVRLYAEDPAKGFLPRTGQIALWQAAVGEGVRIDSGIDSGQAISPYYDPMLAKVIAWGPDRETARHRLMAALKNTLLFGTTSNKRFLIDILERETFAKGLATTAFIDQEFSKADLKNSSVSTNTAAIAAVIQYALEQQQAMQASLNVADDLLNWSSTGHMASRYVYQFAKQSFDLLVSPTATNCYQVALNDQALVLELLNLGENTARLRINGVGQTVYFLMPEPGVLLLSVEGANIECRNELAFSASAEAVAGDGQLLAPMHGVMQELLVSVGDAVKQGQRVAVVEAMKMQHDIVADIDGTIEAVAVAEGSQVAANDILIAIAGC